MRFQHFLITRFSFRPIPGHPDSRLINRLAPAGSPLDPLDRGRLDLRFAIFEMVCVPSVLSQTQRDFTWVIVIDPALPQSDRERLATLTAGHERTVIHDYDPERPISELEWLRGRMTDLPPDYLLTSNLDADDGVPPTFIEELHGLVNERDDQVAPLELFGATETTQWELSRSRWARWGYWANWHRKSLPMSSCGFSLLARYPEYDLTVAGLPHSIAPVLLDWGIAEPEIRVLDLRGRLLEFGRGTGDQLQAYPIAQTLHSYTSRTGSALMTNHRDNVQRYRIHEWKARSRVRGPDSLPNAVIDWAAFERHASLFGPRRRGLLSYWHFRLRKGHYRLRRDVRARTRVRSFLHRCKSIVGRQS